MNVSELPQLIARLDQDLVPLCGYGLRVTHYAHAPGEHRVEVQAYPQTVEDAQNVANTLGVEFHQSERWAYSYEGQADGVSYGFHLDREDTTGYPPTFTPAPITA